MRHLGVMWDQFRNRDWRRLVLTEASFRVAKKTLGSLMRKAMANIHLATDEPFHRVIVGYLNFLFASSEESTNYWNTEFRWNLETNFFFVGDIKERLTKKVKNIKKSVDLYRIAKMLPEAVGFQMKEDVITGTKLGALHRAQVVVDKTDILSIYPVVSSGLTEHPKAFLLYHQVGVTFCSLFFRRGVKTLNSGPISQVKN